MLAKSNAGTKTAITIRNFVRGSSRWTGVFRVENLNPSRVLSDTHFCLRKFLLYQYPSSVNVNDIAWKPILRYLAEKPTHLRPDQRRLLYQLVLRQYGISRTSSYDSPLRQEYDFGVRFCYKLDIVGNHNHSLPLRVQLEDEVPQPLLLLVVLTDRRLVENQIVWFGSEDGSESDSLPLTSAEKKRRTLSVLGQTKRFKGPLHLLVDHLRGESEVFESERDLVLDRLRK